MYKIQNASAIKLYAIHVLQGYVTVTFYMTPTDDVITFSDVYACASDIFDYTKHHENWGDAILLPPPPGCPLLVFDPPVFTHNGEEWICP